MVINYNDKMITSQTETVRLFQSDIPEELAAVMKAASHCRDKHVERKVFLRGLIEISNHCNCNCLYCGIRRGNQKIQRYRLDDAQIVSTALHCFQLGFHSICLQAGEDKDDNKIKRIADTVQAIRKKSKTMDPEKQGLGITLSLGELRYEQYQLLREAGAHRYLLRMETSNPDLFQSIHPPAQRFETRLECLHMLKELGYMMGTGVMIGLPGQTAEDLWNDLMFFKELNVDMLGMGPYIPHADTPLARSSRPMLLDPFAAALKMIALARLSMPDINIVASTALQTLYPDALEQGLNAGANVVMPIMTPQPVRSYYQLYINKQERPPSETIDRIAAAGYTPGLCEWGDAPHYVKRARSEGLGVRR
ncbi:MAG: [FeFe] hydrogenase H-cluster radical SAM maturase HydE [Bacillota bacterium]|nr:[FeFe] hydrogenase H-cluster radical SAM maturase HydE [Bacillota bacterium]